MFSRALVAAAAVLLAGIAAATSGSAASTTVSPCQQVSLPTWSPDGTQIAYYGRRWPAPTGHRNPNSILQALCTMKPDGTNVQQLRYTVCSENCPDPPGPIVWLQSGILYLRDGVVYRIAPGSKPHKVARVNAVSIATNPAGTRIATDLFSDGCLSCKGPVSILDAQSGAVVGTVGGKKLENINPSLSPSGAQVAFERNASDDSGKTLGIWTASVKGRNLRQLAKVGRQPFWSPAGNEIAYVAPAGKSVALRLISPTGGKSRVLVARNVQNVFGWSPDGRYVALEVGTGTFGELSVVDVTTGKVRSLLRLYGAPSAAWAPDSSELVANTIPKAGKGWSTWRVPADGSQPTKISSSG
jgi:Tol biopolymer transport system component